MKSKWMKNSGGTSSSGNIMSNSATPATTFFSLFCSVVQKADKERYIDGSDWSVAKAMLSASGFTVHNCAIRSAAPWGEGGENSTILEIDLWSMLLSFADCFRWSVCAMNVLRLCCTRSNAWTRAPAMQTTNGDECRQLSGRHSCHFSPFISIFFELWRKKIEKHLYFIGNRFVLFCFCCKSIRRRII